MGHPWSINHALVEIWSKSTFDSLTTCSEPLEHASDLALRNFEPAEWTSVCSAVSFAHVTCDRYVGTTIYRCVPAPSFIQRSTWDDDKMAMNQIGIFCYLIFICFFLWKQIKKIKEKRKKKNKMKQNEPNWNFLLKLLRTAHVLHCGCLQWLNVTKQKKSK